MFYDVVRMRPGVVFARRLAVGEARDAEIIVVTGGTGAAYANLTREVRGDGASEARRDSRSR